MSFRTNAVKVQAFAGAMFGIQVGTTTMAQINADITSVGGLANALNGYYASSFGNATTASVAATVAANLGITGAPLAEAVTYITAQLNAAAPGARGAVISTLLDNFANGAADATYGAFATAYNTKVAAAAAYTGTSNVAIGTVVATSSVFTLGTGADILPGTSANDTFNAYDTTATTWTVGDSINGGDGTDTLNIVRAAAIASAPVGSSVTNVETANVTSGATLALNTSTWTGLTTLNGTGVGGTTLTAAATTDVALVDTAMVTTTDAGVTVNGGKNVTLTLTAADATTDGDAAAEVAVGATTAAAGTVAVALTGKYTDGADNAMSSIAVTGGTAVTVTTATGLTAAQILAEQTDTSNNTITQSAVTVTGNSATTSVTVNQAASVTEVDTANIGRIGVVGGAVDIFDANRASTTGAGTIATVTLNNAGAATVDSGALTTLNLSGKLTTVNAGTLGALTTAANSALALNLTGAVSTGAVTIDSDIKTLNISGNTTASTLNSLVASGATTINVSGDAKVTLTGNTAAAATAINVTNTGGFAMGGTAIGATATFTGGAGADAVILSNAFTKAITMGAGNDTVTYGGAASTTTGAAGSVNAGDGTDIIIMTTAQANAADDSSVFNASFTGFETLSISDAHTTTVDLDGVNAATKVVLTLGSNAGVITNLSSGGTVDMMAEGGGALTVNMKSALVGATDVLNVNLLNTAAFANTRTLNAANIETVNIGLADASAATANGAAAVIHTSTLVATSAKTVTVTGNNGLTLTNTGNTAITSFDASGVVANSAAATKTAAATTDSAANLAVTFASANTTATANVSITGGAGNDTLTGTVAKDTISGGAGADAIYSDNAGNKTAFATADVTVNGAGGGTGVATAAISFMGLTINTGNIVSAGANTTLAEVATGVRLAVNTDPVLSKLLVATGAGAAVVFTSLVDGTTATLPTVVVTQTTNSPTYTAGTATAGTAGTVAVDVLNGGAGADVLVGGGGADTITTGAGADNVFFLKAHSVSATMSTITDYTFAVGGASNDKIILGDVTSVIGTTTTVQDLSAQTTFAAALGSAALTNTVDNGLSVFIYGGDTYAFVETTGATGSYTATDFVVKLTGTPLAAGTTIAGTGFDAV